MRRQRSNKIGCTLTLFIITIVASTVALALAFTIGCLPINQPKFVLSSTPHQYLQQKYLSAQARLFTICAVGLSVSLLFSLIGTILCVIQYRRQQSSYQLMNPKIVILVYLCVALNVLGSLVAVGVQLSVLVEIDEEKNVGKWFSVIFGGVAMLLGLLNLPSSEGKRYEVEQIIIKAKVSTIAEYPSIYQSLPKEKRDQLGINDKGHSAKDQSFFFTHKNDKANIKSTKSREQIKEHRAMLKALMDNETKKPLLLEVLSERNNNQKSKVQEESQEDKQQEEEVLKAVDNMTQSQKMRQKVPRLQIDLIKKREKELSLLNQLEISSILPAQVIKTAMAGKAHLQGDQLGNKELRPSCSVLSYVNQGKIPEQVPKRERPDLRQYRCDIPSIKGKQMQNMGPVWISPPESFEEQY